MLVYYYNVRRADGVLRQLKANTPLVVDPDAELSLPVAAQGLQPVAGKRPQVVQARRSGQNIQPFVALLRKKMYAVRQAYISSSLKISLGGWAGFGEGILLTFSIGPEVRSAPVCDEQFGNISAVGSTFACNFQCRIDTVLRFSGGERSRRIRPALELR
jgi:hypothetical protein